MADLSGTRAPDESTDDSVSIPVAESPVDVVLDSEAEQQFQLPPSTPEPVAHDTGAMPVVVIEPAADGATSGVVSEWMQCMNEHGETYFCNVYTGETSWQLPCAAEASLAEFESLGRPDGVAISGGGDAVNQDGVYDQDSTGEHAAGVDPLDPAQELVARAQRKSFQLVRQVLEGSLRRLDRNVQMQLEEARRRHRELDELRDEQVRLGSEHWVEMYDPTHDCFYYYGMFSGDMRWDKPDSYVMKAESDAILRVVVKLQCAFRMTLARKRVFQMKLLAAERARQALLLEQHDQQPSGAVSGISDDAAQPEQKQPHVEQAVGVQAEDLWIEVYDPFHKVVYYYCSSTGETRWDPPALFISANEDKEMAAAIAIQSLSRSFLARRNVKQRKLTLRKKRQEQAVDEARRLRELHHRDFLSKSEDERSSICRREMIEEEMEQIRGGDRFWGIDAYDREVRRQQTEERLMATAETFWQRVNLTMKMRGEQNQHKSKEQELKRREHEAMAEANARDAMSAEEAQQRRLRDNFWGVQGEEQRESRARRDMQDEELRSRCFGQELHVRDLHLAWRAEAESNSIRDAHDKVANEKRYQRKYMKWFYQDCSSVDDLLDYLWPTKQRFEPQSTLKSSAGLAADAELHDSRQTRQQQQHSSSYVLDDLVVKQRLESGDLRYGNKSIFTIHHPNSAQILGRKGGFRVEKVEKTKAVFETTAAIRKPLSTSPSRPAPPHVEMTPEEEEHLRMGTSVHYKRSKTPDPNVPARFNGIPFKPSQISPTREILCSSHTKMTQLPSLSSKKSPSKGKMLAKQSIKTKPSNTSHAKTSSNNNSSSSPRSRSSMQRHLSLFGTDVHQPVDPKTTTFGFAGPYAMEDALRQRCQLEYDEEHTNASGGEESAAFDGDNVERGADDGEDTHAAARARQLRHQTFAEQFAREEYDVLRCVFLMMDYDGSGAVNKQEMTWALQRDEEVSALASRSTLLRVLLKEHTHLDELFGDMEAKQSDELSWEIFIAYCEQRYVELMDQGSLSLPPNEHDVLSEPNDHHRTQRRPQTSSLQPRSDENENPNAYREDEEEQKIRDLFAFLDYDANGVLEVEELQHALYDTSNDDITQLVQSSKALQPLLRQAMFMDAFRKFETEDPRGISEEEFVGFCLEIASIALLNDML